MDFTQIFLFFVVLIVSLTVHEAAHAFMALKGGDRTAYLGGQVTLNPIPHMQREPFGMVILPLLMLLMSAQSGSLMCMGYASTPIDPVWAYHHPKKAALMSAAGPVANLLLAALALGIIAALYPQARGWQETVLHIAHVFFLLNLLLFLFNLFPVPPLDGAGVIEGFFPKARSFYGRLRSQPMLQILGIIVMIAVMREIFWPIAEPLLAWAKG